MMSESRPQSGGFIYLEHLCRITGLQRRQLWPVTALSSCLVLEGQQYINQSEDKRRKHVQAEDQLTELHFLSVEARLMSLIMKSMPFVWMKKEQAPSRRAYTTRATPCCLQLTPHPEAGI